MLMEFLSSTSPPQYFSSSDHKGEEHSETLRSSLSVESIQLTVGTKQWQKRLKDISEERLHVPTRLWSSLLLAPDILLETSKGKSPPFTFPSENKQESNAGNTINTNTRLQFTIQWLVSENINSQLPTCQIDAVILVKGEYEHVTSTPSGTL